MELTKDNISELSAYIYKKYTNSKSHTQEEVQQLLLEFLEEKENEKFLQFDLDLIKQSFKHRHIKYPNFKNVEYKLIQKKHKKFATGNINMDYCYEIMDIKYEIKSNKYDIHLEICYECTITPHCGGIEEYKIIIDKFIHNGNNNHDIILSDIILYCTSKIAYIMCDTSIFSSIMLSNKNEIIENISENNSELHKRLLKL
jgi:hypothetical protein